MRYYRQHKCSWLARGTVERMELRQDRRTAAARERRDELRAAWVEWCEVFGTEIVCQWAAEAGVDVR